jgi:hypothetical protein
MLAKDVAAIVAMMMMMMMMMTVSYSTVERHVFTWPRNSPKEGQDIFWKNAKDQLHQLYPSPNIIREIKCKMDEMGGVYIRHET